MLIDEFLSDYDFVEKHAISIHANAETIYRAANEVDFGGSFIIRWLLRLRGMSGTEVSLKTLRESRFAVLGEIPNHELLLGLVGKFWTPRGELRKIDAESFRGFDTPGYAKAVWNFSLLPEGDGSRLMTETRVRCLDAKSRGSFGFYWMFIRPFSGLIRMEMLRAIKHEAETA
jgi:hypothetical protein